MRAKSSLFALLLGSVLASGAFAMSATSDDPYAWLEDVHGAKPLDWVREQNARSLGMLKADPRYQKNYDSIPRGLGCHRPHSHGQPATRPCL